MGSQSDWRTMKAAAQVLDELGVDFEARILSAHRTPDRMRSYAASAAGRGIRALIAGAGGAAHLPGMLSAYTRVPVIGVPVESSVLHGVDSLCSIVQMPRGFPVATMAIGPAGAYNGALLAAAILALGDEKVAERLEAWRSELTASVAEAPTDE